MPWGKQYSAVYLYLILRTRKAESIWDSFFFFLNIKFERRLEKKNLKLMICIFSLPKYGWACACEAFKWLTLILRSQLRSTNQSPGM